MVRPTASFSSMPSGRGMTLDKGATTYSAKELPTELMTVCPTLRGGRDVPDGGV